MDNIILNNLNWLSDIAPPVDIFVHWTKQFFLLSIYAASASTAAAQASSQVTPSAPEIKKERLDTAAGTSLQNSTNASQSTSSASPTVVPAVKSEPDAGKAKSK